MKVLVLQGSPKGNSSNTYKLTQAFIEGLGTCDAEILDLYKLDLHECRGCFACWNKTPGKCVIDDDMASVIKSILASDIIIWSFPLYYFSVPSRVKMVMDRMLPMNLPFMSKNDGGGHPSRYDMTGKHFVVISTCGFYTTENNYSSVSTLFDRLYAKNYERIYCAQGELFRVKELSNRTDEYLQLVKQAGTEFKNGKISDNTKKSLEQPLYSREVFEQMADASWGVSRDGKEKENAALTFTRQMAALYDKTSWTKDIILEMNYTDENVTLQIKLGKDGQQVITKDFLPYTTKIETTLKVWQSIARGEISGQEAMMKKMYTVQGDFSTMLNWDKLFGNTSDNMRVENKKEIKEKKTNMLLMLIPWIVLFSVLPINATAGAISGIIVAALMPLMFFKWKLTVYEYITVPAVTIISLSAMLGTPLRILVPFSYLAFGLMWFISGFMKYPLSSLYSMNNYGYEKALENPLFILTNRILTFVWGILYMLMPIWTYILMGTDLSRYTGLINFTLPVLMGIFTVLFQKWYPAHYAKK
jgi:multimeric flavodoxin WrbA